MKNKNKFNINIVWLLIAILIIATYYIIGIAIAESDMSPWLKYLFLK